MMPKLVSLCYCLPLSLPELRLLWEPFLAEGFCCLDHGRHWDFCSSCVPSWTLSNSGPPP
eukprot:2677923-Amphidinium_carterae.2